jgi:catechol 2,3-dioxygenase-like lactoylglutathione lyase family enzyme
MLQRLIPKVFYDHLDEGIDFFVDGLGFEVLHQDDELAVVARDGAKVYLVESPEFAAKDRPELAIETDTIGVLHVEIRARRPDLLHPNGKVVEKKPWGAMEFAVRDATQVCVVFRQWPNA